MGAGPAHEKGKTDSLEEKINFWKRLKPAELKDAYQLQFHAAYSFRKDSEKFANSLPETATADDVQAKTDTLQELEAELQGISAILRKSSITYLRMVHNYVKIMARIPFDTDHREMYSEMLSHFEGHVYNPKIVHQILPSSRQKAGEKGSKTTLPFERLRLLKVPTQMTNLVDTEKSPELWKSWDTNRLGKLFMNLYYMQYDPDYHLHEHCMDDYIEKLETLLVSRPYADLYKVRGMIEGKVDDVGMHGRKRDSEILSSMMERFQLRVLGRKDKSGSKKD